MRHGARGRPDARGLRRRRSAPTSRSRRTPPGWRSGIAIGWSGTARRSRVVTTRSARRTRGGTSRPARRSSSPRRCSPRSSTPSINPAEVHVLTKKAIDAGCNDPLILYLNARTSVGTHFPGLPQYYKLLREAAVAMSASQYSPYRKAVAEEAAIRLGASKANLSEKERLEVEKRLDAIIDLLAESVAEDPRNQDWESGWFEKINAVIAWHRKLGGDYKAAFDRVDARLAKIKGIEALRLTVKGFFLVTWAWEARTDKVGSRSHRRTVPHLRTAVHGSPRRPDEGLEAESG